MTKVIIDFTISPEEIMALHQECISYNIIMTPTQIKSEYKKNVQIVLSNFLRTRNKVDLENIKNLKIKEIKEWIKYYVEPYVEELSDDD